ncbi:hypothetical protein GCM10027614_68110 [Micromonospora vulcania]
MIAAIAEIRTLVVTATRNGPVSATASALPRWRPIAAFAYWTVWFMRLDSTELAAPGAPPLRSLMAGVAQASTVGKPPNWAASPAACGALLDYLGIPLITGVADDAVNAACGRTSHAAAAFTGATGGPRRAPIAEPSVWRVA